MMECDYWHRAQIALFHYSSAKQNWTVHRGKLTGKPTECRVYLTIATSEGNRRLRVYLTIATSEGNRRLRVYLTIATSECNRRLRVYLTIATILLQWALWGFTSTIFCSPTLSQELHNLTPRRTKHALYYSTYLDLLLLVWDDTSPIQTRAPGLYTIENEKTRRHRNATKCIPLQCCCS